MQINSCYHVGLGKKHYKTPDVHHNGYIMNEREKRKLERFNLKIPAKIEAAISEGEEIPDLMTGDTGSGGAFFHTLRPLPEGTDVEIDLVLPIAKLKKLQDDYPQIKIEITGTLLRSESKGMAIHFNRDYDIHPRRRKQPTRH